MTIYYKIFSRLIAAGILVFSLASCSRTAEPETIGDGCVTFSAELAAEATATANDASGSKAATKAAQITSIDKFKVTAWNNGDTDKTAFISDYKEFNYSGSTVSTDIRWTKPYAKVFYAYANLPASGATVASADYTGQTLAYTVPTDAANQNDILMGTYAGDGTSTRTAALNFKHALTAVQFTVGTLTNVKKITSITIKGVYASGSVTQASNGTFADWTGTSDTQDATQTITADLPTTAGTAIGVPFILIPQTNAAGIEVEMELTLTDDTTMTCTGTLGKTTGGIEWLAGKTNTYTISVSGLNTLSFEYSITAWGDVSGGNIDMEEEPQQPDDEIWYITSDGKVANVNSSATFGGLTVLSNTYANGKGIIKLSGTLKEIGTTSYTSPNCFYQQQNLTKIYFPPQVESIGWNTIMNCYYISEIYIPVTVTYLAYNFCWDWFVRGGIPDPCLGEPLYIIVGNNRQEISKGGAGYITLGNGEQAHIGTMCFVEGTMISLSNGSSKKVEELTYGDDLLVWNFDAGKYDSAKLLWISKGRKEVEYYKITLSDGSTINLCGSDGNCHRLFNYTDKIFQYPTKMEIGTEIFTLNGIAKLVSVERLKEDVTYYNLITDRHINCFADGILTSCRYNNLYPIDENMKFVKESRKKRPYSEFKDSGISREWYNGLRLSEQTDSLDNIVKYVSERVALQQPKPTPNFWQKFQTWWKSIFG